MKNYQTTGVLITGLMLISVLLASTLFVNNQEEMQGKLSYSEFMIKVQAGEISRVILSGQELEAIAKPIAPDLEALKKAEKKTEQTSTDAKGAVKAENKEAAATAKEPKRNVFLEGLLGRGANKEGEVAVMRYQVMMPLQSQDIWLPKLEAQKVAVEIQDPAKDGQWWGIVISLIVPLAIGILIFMLIRNMASGGSQAMNFGKSKAKLMVESNVKIGFGDVAGIDEAKEELEEVVDFLKNADRYQKLGAKIPKGVLLVGAPGTGKTLLAKAVAGEAGVPFFSISGSDFVEMFVGVGASRVRDLFEQAKKQAPCIVFIDEIDAVGRQRGAGTGGGHDEREQTLNQMLVEMDGFDSTTGIIIIAATNRPDILDSALLRPGRFDRRVMIDRPDLKGRAEILDVHSKGKPLADDVVIKKIARRTSGFSGADLANLLNEGALLAARRHKEVIEAVDIEDSIDRVVMGLEKKSKVIKEKDKESTAYHEIGHALTGYMTEGQDPLRKVTIIPRGFALGYAWYAPEDEFEKVSVTKKELLGDIAVSLAGRIAEEIIYGSENVSTGASNDLMKVAKIARKMVITYGMTDAVGAVQYDDQGSGMGGMEDFMRRSPEYSQEIAAKVDHEVRRIVDEQYAYVTQLLIKHRDLLEKLTRILLEKETLDGDEFNAIVKDYLAKQSAV